MEQDHDYSPPTVWSQPPLTTTRRRKPRIDPVVLIILIPILVLVFLFFFLPPFLYHASHILKPGSVKSTWDSLNIFLVLFAIICGVMARKNDDNSSSTTDQGNGFVATTTTSSNSINLLDSSGQWVGFSDRKVGLRRNSSSYPDLRQESVWENYDYPNRYFDDFHLNSSPVSRYYNTLSRRIQKEKEIMHMDPMTPVPGDVHRRSRRSEADPVEFSDIKEIGVDTFEVISNVPPATPPPPPPPPRRPPNSKRHSFRSVGREIESDELKKVRSPPPPPPPPPATEVRVHRSRHRHNKLERKVSDATKEIATAISSLYNNQRKRKNKRKLRNVPEISGISDTSPTSSVHSIQSPGNEQPLQTLTPTPPPPPPPPPPPSTMFQNLFKKGGKHKRIHSVPQRAPPPPPPPPPNSIFNNIFKSGNKSKRFLSPRTMDTPPLLPPSSSSIMNNIFKTGTKSKRFNSITGKSTPPPPPPLAPPGYSIKNEPRSSSKGKPPLPAPKTSGYYEREEFIASGSESPLIPMAAPPAPPFRMAAMKFEVRGDFVKVQSSHSSVCSSPDRGDFEISSMIIDGGDSVDVNAMADSFISRLKDEWRMEKINYVKDKLT